MPLHLIKLSVGTDSIEDLEDWIKLKLKEQKKRGVKKPQRVHTTRMVPKRAEEILDGGSIFWVIKGEILCRERILGIEPFTDKDGIGRCKLILDPKCVPVRPRPYRAFQGWRYLDVKDAPPDLDRVAKGRFEAFTNATNQKFAAYESKFADYEAKLSKANKVIEELLKLSQLIVDAPAAQPEQRARHHLDYRYP